MLITRAFVTHKRSDRITSSKRCFRIHLSHKLHNRDLLTSFNSSIKRANIFFTHQLGFLAKSPPKMLIKLKSYAWTTPCWYGRLLFGAIVDLINLKDNHVNTFPPRRSIFIQNLWIEFTRSLAFFMNIFHAVFNIDFIQLILWSSHSLKHSLARLRVRRLFKPCLLFNFIRKLILTLLKERGKERWRM